MMEPIPVEVSEWLVRELPRWLDGQAALRQKLAEALWSPTRPGRLTYAQFLAWADEDTLAEWVDGEVVMATPAGNRHQDVVGFLDRVLGTYVEERGAGVVRVAPFQMKLTNGREPDLLFVAREHLSRLKETYLDGAADLLVEVVSPDSAARDRGDKFYEYEAGGVPEYWIVDPTRKWAEFYRLGEAGVYEVLLSGREGVYRSEAVPGFWLRLEWLWQEPLPRTLDVLRELGVIES